MLVSEAVTRTRDDLLDDSGQERWDVSDSTHAETKRHLQNALSYCYHLYNTQGGTQFLEEHSGTTTTSGVLSLDSLDPAHVRSCNLLVSNRYYSLYPERMIDREYQDDQARVITVQYAPTPEWNAASGNDSDYLLQHPNTNSELTSWDAFEDWVCWRAALTMSIKDQRRIVALKEREEELARACLARINTPKTRRFPGRKDWYTQWLRWHWDPQGRDMIIHRKVIS